MRIQKKVSCKSNGRNVLTYRCLDCGQVVTKSYYRITGCNYKHMRDAALKELCQKCTCFTTIGAAV